MKLKMIAACAAILVGQSAFALGDAVKNGGDGGSVIGSGNSANQNTNLQGQAQGQGQMQGQAAIGVGLGGAGGSSASSSSASSNSTSNASNGNQTMTGGQQAQDNRVSIEGDKVTYQAQERNPVSTAYAPSIAPTAACAIGTSVGAQGASFGLSFGTSNIDANCQLLEQIRSAASVLGDRATAAEMMCEVPAYKAARERLGKPCGTLTTAKAAPVATPQATAKPVAARAGCDYTGTDPFILARRCR